MPPAPPLTPVRAPRGRRTHARTLGAASDGLTLCGLRCDGWAVSTEPIDCPRCAGRAPC